MGRVKSAKDLPEGVLEFESTPEGDIVFGEELKTFKKQRNAASAKEELAKTDTLGNKAKAIGKDVMDTISMATFRKSHNPRSARVEHNDKVKSLKKEAGMKKGGSVSSASKRADGCAIRGKTRA